MNRCAIALILVTAAAVGLATSPSMADENAPARAALTQAQPNGKGIGTLFVSDSLSNAVWVCSANIKLGMLPPYAQLQGVGGPIQLAIDRAGTVYVANAQVDGTSAGSVTEYPRGSLVPSRTLSSGLDTSTGVAVDSAGTVYVSNKYARSIAVFPAGRTRPAVTITANLAGPDGLAVDGADNLYIVDGSANQVLKLAHGSMTPRPLHLTGLSTPIGIAIDSHDNLYVSNLSGITSHVAVYPPHATAPSQTFVVPGQPFGPQSTVGQPQMLSMWHDTLLASTMFSLDIVDGTLGGPSVVAFTAGQTTPLWNGYGLLANDAVFQSK